MKLTEAILAGVLLLSIAGCAGTEPSPEPAPGYGPFFEGYAVREEVEPASFPNTFEPDTLLPGEDRLEVLEVPVDPEDSGPPPDLDQEPIPPEPFPYGTSGSEWNRPRRQPRPK